MKLLRWIFLALFILSIAYTGVLVAREMPGIKKITARLEENKNERQTVNKELAETNIKYRGFLESTSEIPDSLKVQETGNTMRMQKEYHKQVYHMEGRERELKRLIRKDERKLAAVYDGLKSRFYILGAVILVTLAGTIITARAAIRS